MFTQILIPITLRPVRLHPRVVIAILLLLSATFIGGCASKGLSVSDAALSGDPTAMARDGATLNTRGAKLIKDAEKRLIEGRKQLRDGEAMVQSGSTRVTNSRFEYKDLANASGNATSPGAVAEEAKKLRTVGNRWEDAIESIRDGNKLVDKGNKTIAGAQEDIRKGRQMMEQGSTLVRNSARIGYNQALLPMPE